MENTSTDCIEKQIELKAPIDRVWRALTDYKEFSTWFQVNLEAPFVTGEKTRGKITYPGCEHMTLEVLVQKMETEKLFSFHWNPLTEESIVLDSSTPTTLVEFELEPVAQGTMLRITESGFDALPVEKRDEAWRRNDAGWTEQVRNIEAHVTNNQ
ncbi:MAG: SRPBCC family protein [Planctomycetota bacterium]|jgi:uncharacterized protein YndB with AHSA1/START domain